LKFSHERTDATSKGVDPTVNKKLSINPYLTYIFTDNVTGTLEYSGSKTEDNTDVTTDNRFALVIDIRFR
jgi:hypothetical protein